MHWRKTRPRASRCRAHWCRTWIRIRDFHAGDEVHCEQILRGLPNWFEIEFSLVQYVTIDRDAIARAGLRKPTIPITGHDGVLVGEENELENRI